MFKSKGFVCIRVEEELYQWCIDIADDLVRVTMAWVEGSLRDLRDALDGVVTLLSFVGFVVFVVSS